MSFPPTTAMGSSNSKKLVSNPLVNHNPTPIEHRMEMQRCTMTQKVLVTGAKTSGIQELMKTIHPSEHHEGKLLSFCMNSIFSSNSGS
jgi:hypothetical protein